MAHLPFFITSFAWNFALGMTWLVIPLYADAQGLSAAEIGVLFSVPAIGQTLINLVGGAYTDRVGGRLVMLASCVCLAVGGLGLIFAEGFWGLFAGQSLLVLSRAVFWPANWAIATELPGDRGTQVGRLNSVTYFAHILGNASCGFVLAFSGFQSALAMIAALGLVSFAFSLRTPARAARAPARGNVFASYAVLARMRVIYYTLLCAYLSALPMTLSMSFYPLLLKDFGFGESASGMLISLRAVGGIAAGLLLGRYVTSGPASRWPLAGGIGVALAVGLLPLQHHWLVVGALMFIVGLGAGLMTLYVQITMSEVTSVERRGSALALIGLGWSLSHLTTPLITGLLAERFGIDKGFYVLGAIALLFVVAIALARRHAFSGTALAERVRIGP